jgi:hypothetical protein
MTSVFDFHEEGSVRGMLNEASERTREIFAAATGLAFEFHEALRQGCWEGFRAVAAEGLVEVFQAVDEVDDFLSRVGPAGGGAEVGAAAKWAAVVDQAASGFLLQEGAYTVGSGGEAPIAGAPPGFGGGERFAFGQERGAAGQFELAALRPADAVALDGAAAQFVVDLPDLGDCGIGSERGTMAFHTEEDGL